MMVQIQSAPLLRYGIAASAALLALLLTALLQPLLDRSLFLLFFGAVIISAWHGGVGPALLTIGVSIVACQYFLVNPAGILVINPSEDIVRLLVFVLMSLFICALIVAHKRTERALHESEARARCLVDSNIVGVIHSNFDGRILDANDAFLEMVGYTRDELRAGKVRWDEITPSEYRYLSQGAMESLRTSGVCPPLEKEYVRKNGSRVPVLIGLALLEGTWDQAMCFVLDLSETKRAEDALKQVRDHLEIRVQEQTGELKRMNEELKSEIADHKRMGEVLREQAGLLDLTHDSVFVRDMKDVITYWNRGAERLYGWAREEAIGKVCHQLTQTIFPAQIREITGELLRTGRWDGELVHMKRDGTQVVVASRWALQRDEQGQPVAILETNNDITERKRIEFSLHEREGYLTQILRSVPLVLYRAHPAESFGALWISDTVELVTGFPVRQFIEDSQFWASRVHPEDRDRVLAEFGAIDQKDGLTTEYRWQCADGTYRWFLDQAGINRDTEGQFTAILGTWQDITERKRAEEVLRQLSGRLLRLQDEERRHIARELHDSTAQTLAALSMNLTAVERVATVLSEEARKALTESLALARHASRELRTLSYLLHPPMLDESGLASALGWYVDGFAQRSGIEVELDISPQLGRMPSDVETTLFRIVQECLTNVLKHSESQTANVEVVLSPAQVTLEVSDQGKGMRTNVLRGSGDVVSGLGVGISGMFERVRQLRGSMNITSGDWGTSVRVSLPLGRYEA